MVVACIALILSLTGTAVATVTTVGRNSVGTPQLKNNAVTTKKVKNGSLLRADFKAGQVPAGARGATGATGATGAAGPAGPQGPIGPSNAVFSQSATNILTWTTTVAVVQSLNLPAGKWVVISKVLGNSNDGAIDASIDCTLNAGATVIDDGFDNARVGTSAADDREYFTYFGALDLAAAGTVELRCSAGSVNGNWLNRRIVAIQVGAIS
jgi:hypothetical protein